MAKGLNAAATDYRAVAESLFAFLEAGVERSLADHNVVPESIEALHSSGLFRMQVPECLGGGEVDSHVAFDVVERISQLDGSLGWTYMAGANILGTMGAFLGEKAVDEVFADPSALAAGQVAPRGVASAVDGGYLIEGQFGFASGSASATWMIGGFREMSGGEPVRLESGLPSVVVAVVPVGNVEMLGNWDVLGLEATGSVDYRVPEQFVAETFTWPLFTSGPRRGGPVYRMGVNGLTCIDHSAFSLGVARRALDEIATIAISKRRAGRHRLVDDPVFQTEYAANEADLGAARAFALEALSDLEQAAIADEVDLRVRARARLATTYAARTAVRVTSFAYRYSGSIGLRNGSTIQQCFRDLTASEAHVFTDHSSWGDAAIALLGVAPPSLFL